MKGRSDGSTVGPVVVRAAGMEFATILFNDNRSDDSAGMEFATILFNDNRSDSSAVGPDRAGADSQSPRYS